MKLRSGAYGVTTVLVVVVFLASGVANLLRVDHVAHDMLRLGYPTYFMTVLGSWKVLGAVAVALPSMPRLKEWAYAGMCFDLTGAAASRAASHDHAVTIVVPLILAGFPGVNQKTVPACASPPRGFGSARTRACHAGRSCG